MGIHHMVITSLKMVIFKE